MTNIAALIVAAGRGSRYGGDGPKQYEMLAGRTLLRHAVEAFADAGQAGAICCAIHADDAALYRTATEGLDLAASAETADERAQGLPLARQCA